jgi:hypothetical protein
MMASVKALSRDNHDENLLLSKTTNYLHQDLKL